MALDIGLDSTGLRIPDIDNVIDDINEAMWATFSTTLDLSPVTPLGEFIQIFAERYVVICELIQAVYSSQDPDAATGDALDALAKLTGTLRAAPTESTVNLTLTGTPTTVVAEGSRAANDAGTEFATDVDATIASVSAWAALTAYTLGQIRTNSSRVYIVITAGTSAASGGPTTTSTDITDGTVHWKYLGEGTGTVDVTATATATGPLSAVAGTVTTIVTPVAGWSSVVNQLDADLGTDLETDEHLRARREDEIANAGVSPLDAIRAALLEIDDITSVTVFQNVTDATNGDGMPPHSVEALVVGGADQDIFDKLHESVAAGIQTHGTETGSVVDSTGTTQTYKFSRPDEIEIYIDIILQYLVDEYPLDGDDQVKAAVVAWGDALPVGYNVPASAIMAQCFKIPGVLDVSVVELGTAPSPSSSATIVITSRQLATFDTSRISLSSSGTATP